MKARPPGWVPDAVGYAAVESEPVMRSDPSYGFDDGQV
jgi:hypothetical protein